MKCLIDDKGQNSDEFIRFLNDELDALMQTLADALAGWVQSQGGNAGDLRLANMVMKEELELYLSKNWIDAVERSLNETAL